MEKQLISRVETITPVLAEEYLKHNTSNRQLRKNIVDYYATQMKKGQWMLNGEAIIFNENGTLVDGQHRLAAIVEAGVNVDVLVVRNADKDSFATIDSGVSRKIQDTFYVKGIPNASGIAAIIGRYFRLCAKNTIADRLTGLKNALSASRQDLLMSYSEDEEFWQEIARMAGSVYVVLRVIPQSEIGAYMAYLIKEKKHDPEKVYGFFEDFLKSDIPKSKMLAALRRRFVSDKNSTTHMDSIYKQQLIIKIWNLYVQGKETSVLRWDREREGKKDFI